MTTIAPAIMAIQESGCYHRSGKAIAISSSSQIALVVALVMVLASWVDRAAALGEAQGYVSNARAVYKKTHVSVGQEGVQVQDGTGVGPGTEVEMYGKGYLVTFRRLGCSMDAACYGPVQADMAKLSCEAFTRYEALNMMGAICFVHAPLTTTDFGLATVRTFQTLQRHRALRGVSVNARIELDPKDPEAVWGLWQPRNPRQRPRWGWSPPPAPVPAPPPAPAPSPAIPRPNPTPPATAAPTLVPTSSPTSSPPLPPDPNIYNWGLDRTNQQDGALDRNNLQCRSRGKGVTIFVLDTGCRASHQELRGRATTESVAVDGVAVFENGGQDGHGHGTHCSGIAAGRNVGTAPDATIRCIKVLNDVGWGMLDHVIAGINTVAEAKQRSPGSAMVTSLSLGAPAAIAARVNDAVNALSQLGVAVVVAAGNSNLDARTTVPASADGALTVGALDDQDAKAIYSNYGDALELYAPGSNIYSSFYTSDADYRTMSGTSMATPAVAGGIACLMAADSSKVCSTKNAAAAKRLAEAMASYKTPGRRVGDLPIDQKIFYIPSDRWTVCPDSSF